LRVTLKDGGYGPLHLNSIQGHIHERTLRSPLNRFIVYKYRQGGVSTQWMGYSLFACLMMEGLNCAFVTHEGPDTIRKYRMVKGMYDRLPPSVAAVLPKLVKADEDAGLAWSNGSRLFVYTAGSEQATRGDTVHLAHWSEFAFWPNPEALMAPMLPALPPEARIIIETTPNGHNYFWELWQANYQNPGASWDAMFIPWWWQREYTLPVPPSFKPTVDEKNLQEAHDLTAGQIMFRRQAIKDHGLLHRQEYPEDAESGFVASGDSAFAVEQIEAVRSTTRPPPRTEFDGLLRVWYDPVPGRVYVIGADSAEGMSNGDLSAAVVMNARSGEHVATLMCNPPYPGSTAGRMSTSLFPRLLDAVGRRYNTAFMVPERNSESGGAVVTRLVDTYEYPHLWTMADGRPGYRTGPTNRPGLVSDFRDAVLGREFSSYDERLPRQMADFILWPRSEHSPAGYEKLGARKGAHDDLLMAAMLAQTGRGRAERYAPSRAGGRVVLAGYGEDGDGW
jgi:hypothetical protein